MDKIFSDDKKALFFVIEEFFLVLLIIFQIYLLLGIQRVGLNLVFFTKPIFAQNILWLVSTILFFLTLYFGITIRDKKVIAVHQEFSKLVFGTTKQKIVEANKEKMVLLFFEFIFAIVLAISIYIYLDPQINWVPWPFNYITFFAILAFGLFLFSKTKVFRESIYESSNIRKKIHPAERLFPTKRITNIRTGSIRIKGKKKN
ncbi:MAG: hypothetical protein PHX27_00710 [Candidatus ainarchaeum sp.]|nr:hypothetical protein [Candidatus ainarchaeum sp.]